MNSGGGTRAFASVEDHGGLAQILGFKDRFFAYGEKIVPTGHQPLVEPRTVEEIRRILLLNLLNLGIRDHRRQLQE
jgi:hypothetical protein